MKPLSRRSLGGLGALLLAFAIAPPTAGDTPPDPLAAEIARWLEEVRTNPSTDPLWLDIKPGSQDLLARADQALGDGHRLLALLRLARVRTNLAGAAYVLARPPEERRDVAGFEAEWARLGKVLDDELGPLSRGSFEQAFQGVRPAAVRAVAEAALPQVKVFYEASLEYGRNTQPDSGLFYLGAAQAQRELAAFCRTLTEKASLPPPTLRSLNLELDALEAQLLAAYRPPVSIDRHGEVIVASAALKEARELDAAGLRHGALLTYLQAVLRLGLVEPPSTLPESEALSRELASFAARLSQGPVDHSLGRLFLEWAEDDLAHPLLGGKPTVAAILAEQVLPKYFAALEPAPPPPPVLAPQTRVTLVRWPYT